jgi:hypothetical protein
MTHRKSQSLCKADEAQHGEVPLAQLNLTNVCRRQASHGAKHRLGQAALPSVLTEGCPKQREERSWIVWLRGPQVMRGHDGILRSYGWEWITSDTGCEGGVAGQWCQKSGHGNLQGLRKAEQHEHGNIMPSMFNLTEIGRRYTRSRGECLLGQMSLFPVLTEGGSQTLER